MFLENSLEKFPTVCDQIFRKLCCCNNGVHQTSWKRTGPSHGVHNNRQCVFDEIIRWQIRYQPVKTATTWLLSEKADTKGKRGKFLLDKTEGGTVSKIPALEHDVDPEKCDHVVTSRQDRRTLQKL